MNLLDFIPLSIFQSAMLILVSKLIIDIKFKKWDYLAVIGIIIPCTILFYFFRQKICFNTNYFLYYIFLFQGRTLVYFSYFNFHFNNVH